MKKLSNDEFRDLTRNFLTEGYEGNEKRRLNEQPDPDIAALSRNIPRQAETIVDKMGDGVWTALGVSNPYASAAEMRTKFPWVNADEVFAFFQATSKGLEELIRNNSGD